MFISKISFSLLYVKGASFNSVEFNCRQYRKKMNVNLTDTKVEYYQYQYYEFDHFESLPYAENDIITMLNVPLQVSFEVFKILPRF